MLLERLTRVHIDVPSPDKNTHLNLPQNNEVIVTGKKTKMEKGHPRITPTAATDTAEAYFSRRKKADDRVTAYIEKLLGRKPGT